MDGIGWIGTIILGGLAGLDRLDAAQGAQQTSSSTSSSASSGRSCSTSCLSKPVSRRLWAAIVGQLIVRHHRCGGGHARLPGHHRPEPIAGGHVLGWKR